MTASSWKLDTSADDHAFQAARVAARRHGMSLSAWLSAAAADAAENDPEELERAQAALDEYIAEFGEPDPETMARAKAALDAAGVGYPEPPEEKRARERALAMLRSGRNGGSRIDRTDDAAT